MPELSFALVIRVLQGQEEWNQMEEVTFTVTQMIDPDYVLGHLQRRPSNLL